MNFLVIMKDGVIYKTRSPVIEPGDRHLWTSTRSAVMHDPCAT